VTATKEDSTATY